MKNKEFLHCLRIQFPPNHYEDERIEEVVEYCVKYGFKNVMLFINAEEYCVGHMTKDEALPWLKTMKKAKRALTEKGISVSLNPWMELGHLDRCRPLKQGQNFMTQVDYDGNECEMVACPLCKNWKEYFLDFYKFIIKEIEPDTVWIEDDFRLHNHGDLKYGGCFCKLHMQKFNEKLNTNYSREEITDRLFRKTADLKVRRAWLDVNRECMVSLAQDVGKAVKELGLGTKVGLMSSMHQKHALEGRDWHKIHEGFACGGEIIDRLHLPCYHEISGKTYYYEFNRIPFACRALLPAKTVIYPELENGSFSSFTKDARFLQFQLESAIPLCILGMTYDIYDFVGNGIVHELKYGEAVKKITPYLNGVTKLNLKYSQLEGIIIPIDEKTVYKRNCKVESFDDLSPDESWFGAYIASVGFATKVSDKKRFYNKIVALGCGNAYNFADNQLIDLFNNNFVVVDGGASRILIDRGLGWLIGAKGYKNFVGEHDVHSYEQIIDGEEINGKKGYRATAFGKAGDYVKIDYENSDGVKSFVYDYLGNVMGVGDKLGKNHFVIPYVINGLYYEQYNALRVELLKSAIKNCGKEFVITNHLGVYAYKYKQKNKTVIIVVNSTEEDFESVELKINGFEFKEIFAVSKTTGRRKKVKFTKRGGKLEITVKNERLSTQTFILK